MTTGPATAPEVGQGGTGCPAGTTARTARIAALPLAFTGRAVAGWGRRLAGADPQAVSAAAMERNAEQLFAVLGQLRGGAMKVGQALAVYESMMPAELAEPYRRALVRLQAQGPAMPARDVHRVLDEQLGRQWRTRLPEFDDVPAAAASIGQVHRARTSRGQAVAVKVQYPGADEALETDLRVLERFARLFTLIVPGLDARAVMRELRARMLEELDYRAEADRQRTFAAEYGGGERLHVPAVVASAPKVLVSEWLDGTSLATLVGRPSAGDADRDGYAHTIVETMFSSPVRVGMVHADPHPGNFMVLRDGRLGMVDFGAAAAMPGGIPPVLARTLRHIADGEPERMMALLRAEGFIARRHRARRRARLHRRAGRPAAGAPVPVRPGVDGRAGRPRRGPAGRRVPGDRPRADPAAGPPRVPARADRLDERAGPARLHRRGPRDRRAVGACVRRRVDGGA